MNKKSARPLRVADIPIKPLLPEVLVQQQGMKIFHLRSIVDEPLGSTTGEIKESNRWWRKIGRLAAIQRLQRCYGGERRPEGIDPPSPS